MSDLDETVTVMLPNEHEVTFDHANAQVTTDGHLTICDKSFQVIAVYAPGAWASMRVNWLAKKHVVSTKLIADLPGVTVKARNALAAEGIVTVADAASKSHDLPFIYGLGLGSASMKALEAAILNDAKVA